MPGVVETLRSNLNGLNGSPRELWMIYSMKVLEAYGYFSTSFILVLFLSEEFDFSDMQAGYAYGLYGALLSLFGFLVGFLIDNLGVRWSLMLSFAISTYARFLLSMTTSVSELKFLLYVALPLGGALGIPVMTLGVKHYTTSASRGFAFGLFYATMNVAALASGILIDVLDIRLMGGATIFGTHFTSKRLIFLSGAGATAVAFLIALPMRSIRLGDDERIQTAEIQQASPLSILRDVVQQPSFWKFLCITLICINLKMMFRYLDAIFPTYLVREFGESFPKGTVYSINPLMIIILVPIIAAATGHVPPIDMILIGGYISAISPIPMAFVTAPWSAILFVVILSLGEAIWSPRFYDLTVSMAPDGREGTFVALSTAPIFLAKLPAGIFSGYLLQKYCPEEGVRDSNAMWRLVSFLSITSPLLLTLFLDKLRPSARTASASVDKNKQLV